VRLEQQMCPPYLQLADELSHARGESALWSENYLSQAYFPQAEVGLWLHQCRPAHDRDLWEEITVIYLPDDRFLLAKGAGLGRGEQGPWGAALRYRCEEPFVRWTKSFRGTARLVEGEEMRAGPLADGLSVGVDMETTWRGLGPAFDWDVSELTWADARSHYEQHCAVTGRLHFGEEEIELDGSGIRDHSWGPRDVAGIGRHIWAHAQFPSGRSFMLFHHVAPDGNLVSHGLLDAGEGIVRAELIGSAPLLTDAEQAGDGYELHLRGGGDTAAVLSAEILQVAGLGLTGLSELVLGVPPGPPASHQLFEGQTRFTWDGETGYGLSERTVRF
jgi:hypothetical protein